MKKLFIIWIALLVILLNAQELQSQSAMQIVKIKVLEVLKNGSNHLDYPMGAMPPMMAKGQDAEDIAVYIAGGMKGEKPASFVACTSCHGEDVKGMSGMSPDLRTYVYKIKCDYVNNQKQGNECLRAGYELYTKNRKKDALLYYEKASSLGNIESLNKLGLMYVTGDSLNGISKNKIKAYHYWMKSAKQGNEEAQDYLDKLCRESPWACK